MSEMNQKIIDEFRSNAGVVGGYFEGHTLLLLHHQGAKSGAERLTPVMYRALDDGYAIFASNNGQDTNPAWYYNLLAHPETQVEVGTKTFEVTAAVATGSDRDLVWDAQKSDVKGFADYEAGTSRQIPVVVLRPN
jgi:deazaflavin-dependent oxidoreductase (nitroreductase family)